MLCCAHGEGERLASIVATLRERGHVVELLEGVELEPRALAAVIENWRGGGLYVLCRGGAFDRDKIDAVREVLLAHRVPFGRTLTLPAADPTGLLERIDQSLRRMVAHLPAAPRGADPRPAAEADPGPRSRRATLMVTPPAAVPPPARPGAPPPPARVAPPAPPSVASRPPPPRPPTPPPAPSPFDPPAAGFDFDDGDLPTRVDTASTAVELDAELLVEDPSVRSRGPVEDELEARVDLEGVLDGIGDTTVVAPVQGPAEGTVVAPAPTRTGTLVAEAIPFEGYADDDDDGPEPGDRTLVAAAPVATPPAPAPMSRASASPQRATVVATVVRDDGPSRLRLGIAAVVGSLALGILATVMLTRDDDSATTLVAEGTAEASARAQPDEPEPEAPAPEAAKPEAATSDAKPEPDATPEPAATPDAKPEPDATPERDATPEPATPDAKPEPDATPDAKPDPDATADAKPEPDTTPAVAPPTAPTAKPLRKVTRPAPPAPPRTRVLKALRERDIRALDVLLVTRRPTKPMSQGAALAHCDGLDIAGLAQWRLPEIGELASLTDAGLVGGGYYWSATPADTFGDSRMAWSGAKRQAGTRAKSSSVICVRGDRGA